MPSLGYAMAYPFGIAGILLTMLGLRAVFRLDPVAAASAFDERRRGEVAAVETMNLMLRNADLAGRTIGDLGELAEAGVIVSRMMRQGQLRVPITARGWKRATSCIWWDADRGWSGCRPCLVRRPTSR